MKLQELFDRAVKPLVAQGERSYDVNDQVCLYRDGVNKCAVGHVISDEHYDSLLEHSSIEDEAVQEAVASTIGEEDGLTDAQINLLSALQDAHDSPTGSGGSEWPEVLLAIRQVAHDNSLDYDEGIVAG